MVYFPHILIQDINHWWTCGADKLPSRSFGEGNIPKNSHNFSLPHLTNIMMLRLRLLTLICCTLSFVRLSGSISAGKCLQETGQFVWDRWERNGAAFMTLSASQDSASWPWVRKLLSVDSVGVKILALEIRKFDWKWQMSKIYVRRSSYFTFTPLQLHLSGARTFASIFEE